MAELQSYTDKIEKRLTELTDVCGAHPKLKEAMAYSLRAGGKRLRPVLNIMANELMDGSIEETLDVACAVEMIHTYSLIHDDLPAMDNDELRRGKPTSHIVFGEALAILAGDGLLNYAFEVMIKNALRFEGNLNAHMKAIGEVARGAGVTGMVSGQCADLENEGKTLVLEEITATHKRKTGDLIRAALLSGLLLQGPDEKQIEAVSDYGYSIGLAFQIVDDILDEMGDQQKMGKTPGKDQRVQKSTYPALLGIDRSRMLAKEKTEQAVDAISVFGPKADALVGLAQKILKRDR
ncbi:MAG: polyprenyl synthetase family protein [Christensenellaceae bacterium]|jgi:geranylgeranyl diphosphate synthase type II